jgi:hypothetical protein
MDKSYPERLDELTLHILDAYDMQDLLDLAYEVISKNLDELSSEEFEEEYEMSFGKKKVE